MSFCASAVRFDDARIAAPETLMSEPTSWFGGKNTPTG